MMPTPPQAHFRPNSTLVSDSSPGLVAPVRCKFTHNHHGGSAGHTTYILACEWVAYWHKATVHLDSDGGPANLRSCSDAGVVTHATPIPNTAHRDRRNAQT